MTRVFVELGHTGPAIRSQTQEAPAESRIRLPLFVFSQPAGFSNRAESGGSARKLLLFRLRKRRAGASIFHQDRRTRPAVSDRPNGQNGDTKCDVDYAVLLLLLR